MPNPPVFSVTPSDIKIGPAGEVTISNPELLARISADAKVGGRLNEAADNYVGCGGNAYQCGKSSGMEELVNQIRTAKEARG